MRLGTRRSTDAYSTSTGRRVIYEVQVWSAIVFIYWLLVTFHDGYFALMIQVSVAIVLPLLGLEEHEDYGEPAQGIRDMIRYFRVRK